MIKIIVIFDIITCKEIIYVIDIFDIHDIHDILDMIDPIQIIIICISDNIYIIDTSYILDIIETSIDVITDEEINDYVDNVNDIFDIHDILDMIDPIEIIIICISGNIYIIDTIRSLDIIETSIDVIADEAINDDVNNVNDFDHIYQTRQLTELINGSYDRGRFQKQYLFWLLVTKMASGSLITIFRQRIINLHHY